MDADTAATLLAQHPFREAKSMKNIPHEYTKRYEWPDVSQFEAVVDWIQNNGVLEMFYNRGYRYFYPGDGYKYWTMGAPADETIILNRAKVT